MIRRKSRALLVCSLVSVGHRSIRLVFQVGLEEAIVVLVSFVLNASLSVLPLPSSLTTSIERTSKFYRIEIIKFDQYHYHHQQLVMVESQRGSVPCEF